MIQGLFVLAALLSFGPRDPEHNGTATTADSTLLWLSALGEGRANTLGAFTAFPFSYGEAWPNKRCTRTVTNADAIGKWVDCTHQKESPFIEELRSVRKDPKRAHLTPGLGAAGKRLRGMAGRAGGRSTWISGWIKGDRATYEFLVAIAGTESSGRRIVAMFIDSSGESR